MKLKLIYTWESVCAFERAADLAADNPGHVVRVEHITMLCKV